jgi:hypothetical protein
LELVEIKAETEKGPDLYSQRSNVARSLGTAASFAKGLMTKRMSLLIQLPPKSIFTRIPPFKLNPPRSKEKGSSQIKKIPPSILPNQEMKKGFEA